MTDKEIIRAEIERQYEILKVEYAKTKGAYVAGRMDALDYVEQFIDSLQEEPKIDAPYEIRFDPANGFDLGSVNVYRDGNLVAQRPEQWKWIDPKYEYPLCLTREMDEYGDWHYALSSGKISETCQYISLAELERFPDEPVDADAAMKELDEKIKLTKNRGSWEGVDVDKFMDEVRGKESDDLEEAAEEYSKRVSDGHNYRDLTCGFIAGAKWQKRKMMEDAVEAEVADFNGELYNRCVECGLTDLDKVKIIIIKDDETIND